MPMWGGASADSVTALRSQPSCTSVGRSGRVSTFYRFVQVLEDLIIIINNVIIIKYNLCISQCLLLYFVNYDIFFICKKITEV